jgi:formamidopyrimidine-DNA glycosylase
MYAYCMPELPEVETVVRGLRASVIGDTIASVWIGPRRQPLKSPAAEIASTLEGAKIAAIRRMGKHIVVDLARSPDHHIAKSPDGHWIVHLGMTGQLVIACPEAEIPKHTHLIARLQSGRELRFTDPRMFGKLAVTHEFDPGGIEPLDLTFDQFVPLFRKRKTPIKSALLNQQLLRGVGNIYADEALFRARVRPRRRAASLTRNELKRLYDSVRQVLQEAIAAGGSSVDDYVGANGERGFFQLQHRVYGREGERCLRCRKTPVKRVVIASRSSHYCPKCQR